MNYSNMISFYLFCLILSSPISFRSSNPQARLEKDLIAQQEMRQVDKKLKDSRKANASAVSRMGNSGNGGERRTYQLNVDDVDVDGHVMWELITLIVFLDDLIIFIFCLLMISMIVLNDTYEW